MALGTPVPHALLWADLETPGLAHTAPIMEVAIVVTDFNLNKIAGYHEVVKLTKAHADALRDPQNKIALEMHAANGLIQDGKKSTKTLADIERECIDLLKQETTFEPGEFILAGSGVAQFDIHLLRAQMPALEKWLTYYQLDVGIMRRTLKILGGGRDFVNPVLHSFGDSKKHRAMADVLAHIEEAEGYREWLRSLA